MSKFGIAQMPPSVDCAQNRLLISALVDEVASNGAQVCVLPEEVMLLAGAVEQNLHELVEQEWPKFLAHLSSLSKHYKISIIAGGYSPGDGVRLRNTIVAFDQNGDLITEYNKLHLYDAFSYQESKYVISGDELPPVIDLVDFQVGVINCYDIRFPELTRSLVDRGANVLIVPAAWLKGARKEAHWETLLSARAIENTIWVIAAGSTSDDCIGNSMIIDPMGIQKARLTEEKIATAVCEITHERLDLVREILPVLKNRRLTTPSLLKASV
jgi:deaminated glutathione amidase